ncbi:hypothetical protein VH441_00895 [Psychrobacter sp. HD31]
MVEWDCGGLVWCGDVVASDTPNLSQRPMQTSRYERTAGLAEKI